MVCKCSVRLNNPNDILGCLALLFMALIFGGVGIRLMVGGVFFLGPFVLVGCFCCLFCAVCRFTYWECADKEPEIINVIQVNSKVATIEETPVTLIDIKPGSDATETTNKPQCCICLNSLDKTAESLPCGHVYHSLCIQTWLAEKNNCPVCWQVPV